MLVRATLHKHLLLQKLMLFVHVVCLLATWRVAEATRAVGGFSNTTEHVYSPASEKVIPEIPTLLVPELRLLEIEILPSDTISVPLCCHVIEAILCGDCKPMTVHVASANAPMRRKSTSKLIMASANIRRLKCWYRQSNFHHICNFCDSQWGCSFLNLVYSK